MPDYSELSKQRQRDARRDARAGWLIYARRNGRAGWKYRAFRRVHVGTARYFKLLEDGYEQVTGIPK
jgi:hypothetical protein